MPLPVRLRASRLLRAAAGPLVALALAACVAQPGPAGQAAALNGPGTGAASPGRKVAILLPLTGPNAAVGDAMLKAARLSLSAPGSPELIQKDTGGTAEGAATAARAALAEGAGIILGPLTAGETAAAGPVARGAGVPMLAFTSDPAQAQPGTWPMGVTPQQQVLRLVQAVKADNRRKLAAVLPQNIFGEALAQGLATATATESLPTARVLRPAPGFGPLNEALKDIADFNNRRGAIEAQQRAARTAATTPDARREATEIGRRTPPPPPMDALLLGITGDLLGQLVPVLSFYDIAPAQTRILGPATWAREALRQPGLAGAWYAAPDPAARAPFDRAYAAQYGAPPRDFASIAYDAAGIARAAATPAGFPIAAITRPEGFAGADGLVALTPDGGVRRGLAVFEVGAGSARIVQPAPASIGPAIGPGA